MVNGQIVNLFVSLQAVIIHQQQKTMAKQKKFILQESEIPTQWYNIQADMPNKPMPPIHPATKQPLGVDDLAHIFPRECCVQELDTEHAWIDIPEEVLDKYKYYRSTPLVRAYALEEALGTPAHIYFKNESTNPLGSHKINSAIPQCYYAKQEGTTNVTTETGAGQWGMALSYAATFQRNAHFRCCRYWFSFNVIPCRKGHYHQGSYTSRFTGNGHLGGCRASNNYS